MRGLPVDQVKIIYLYFLNFILIHLPLIFIFCLILFSVFTKYQTRKRTSKQQIYRLGDISLNKIKLLGFEEMYKAEGANQCRYSSAEKAMKNAKEDVIGI